MIKHTPNRKYSIKSNCIHMYLCTSFSIFLYNREKGQYFSWNQFTENTKVKTRERSLFYFGILQKSFFSGNQITLPNLISRNAEFENYLIRRLNLYWFTLWSILKKVCSRFHGNFAISPTNTVSKIFWDNSFVFKIKWADFTEILLKNQEQKKKRKNQHFSVKSTFLLFTRYLRYILLI